MAQGRPSYVGLSHRQGEIDTHADVFKHLSNQLLSWQGYAKEPIEVVDAAAFTNDWVRRTGLQLPSLVRGCTTYVLFLQPLLQDMRDLLLLSRELGDDREVQTLDVANQAPGPIWTMRQWCLYWKERTTVPPHGTELPFSGGDANTFVAPTPASGGTRAGGGGAGAAARTLAGSDAAAGGAVSSQMEGVNIEMEDDADSAFVHQGDVDQFRETSAPRKGIRESTKRRLMALTNAALADTPAAAASPAAAALRVPPPLAAADLVAHLGLTQEVAVAGAAAGGGGDNGVPPPLVARQHLAVWPAGAASNFRLLPGGAASWWVVAHGHMVFLLVPPSDRALALFASWIATGARDHGLSLLDAWSVHSPSPPPPPPPSPPLQPPTPFAVSPLGAAAASTQRILPPDRVLPPPSGPSLASLPPPTTAGRIIRLDASAGDMAVLPAGWPFAVVAVSDTVAVCGQLLHCHGLAGALRSWKLEDLLGARQGARFPLFKQVMWHAAAVYGRSLRSAAGLPMRKRSCAASFRDRGGTAQAPAGMTTYIACGGGSLLKMSPPQLQDTVNIGSKLSGQGTAAAAVVAAGRLSRGGDESAARQSVAGGGSSAGTHVVSGRKRVGGQHRDCSRQFSSWNGAATAEPATDMAKTLHVRVSGCDGSGGDGGSSLSSPQHGATTVTDAAVGGGSSKRLRFNTRASVRLLNQLEDDEEAEDVATANCPREQGSGGVAVWAAVGGAGQRRSPDPGKTPWAACLTRRIHTRSTAAGPARDEVRGGISRWDQWGPSVDDDMEEGPHGWLPAGGGLAEGLKCGADVRPKRTAAMRASYWQKLLGSNGGKDGLEETGGLASGGSAGKNGKAATSGRMQSSSAGQSRRGRADSVDAVHQCDSMCMSSDDGYGGMPQPVSNAGSDGNSPAVPGQAGACRPARYLGSGALRRAEGPSEVRCRAPVQQTQSPVDGGAITRDGIHALANRMTERRTSRDVERPREGVEQRCPTLSKIRSNVLGLLDDGGNDADGGSGVRARSARRAARVSDTDGDMFAVKAAGSGAEASFLGNVGVSGSGDRGAVSSGAGGGGSEAEGAAGRGQRSPGAAQRQCQNAETDAELDNSPSSEERGARRLYHQLQPVRQRRCRLAKQVVEGGDEGCLAASGSEGSGAAAAAAAVPHFSAAQFEGVGAVPASAPGFGEAAGFGTWEIPAGRKGPGVPAEAGLKLRLKLPITAGGGEGAHGTSALVSRQPSGGVGSHRQASPHQKSTQTRKDIYDYCKKILGKADQEGAHVHIAADFHAVANEHDRSAQALDAADGLHMRFLEESGAHSIHTPDTRADTYTQYKEGRVVPQAPPPHGLAPSVSELPYMSLAPLPCITRALDEVASLPAQVHGGSLPPMHAIHATVTCNPPSAARLAVIHQGGSDDHAEEAVLADGAVVLSAADGVQIPPLDGVGEDVYDTRVGVPDGTWLQSCPKLGGRLGVSSDTIKELEAVRGGGDGGGSQLGALLGGGSVSLSGATAGGLLMTCTMFTATTAAMRAESAESGVGGDTTAVLLGSGSGIQARDGAAHGGGGTLPAFDSVPQTPASLLPPAASRHPCTVVLGLPWGASQPPLQRPAVKHLEQTHTHYCSEHLQQQQQLAPQQQQPQPGPQQQQQQPASQQQLIYGHLSILHNLPRDSGTNAGSTTLHAPTAALAPQLHGLLQSLPMPQAHSSLLTGALYGPTVSQQPQLLAARTARPQVPSATVAGLQMSPQDRELLLPPSLSSNAAALGGGHLEAPRTLPQSGPIMLGNAAAISSQLQLTQQQQAAPAYVKSSAPVPQTPAASVTNIQQGRGFVSPGSTIVPSSSAAPSTTVPADHLLGPGGPVPLPLAHAVAVIAASPTAAPAAGQSTSCPLDPGKQSTARGCVKHAAPEGLHDWGCLASAAPAGRIVFGGARPHATSRLLKSISDAVPDAQRALGLVPLGAAHRAGKKPPGAPRGGSLTRMMPGRPRQQQRSQPCRLAAAAAISRQSPHGIPVGGPTQPLLPAALRLAAPSLSYGRVASEMGVDGITGRAVGRRGSAGPTASLSPSRRGDRRMRLMHTAAELTTPAVAQVIVEAAHEDSWGGASGGERVEGLMACRAATFRVGVHGGPSSRSPPPTSPSAGAHLQPPDSASTPLRAPVRTAVADRQSLPSETAVAPPAVGPAGASSGPGTSTTGAGAAPSAPLQPPAARPRSSLAQLLSTWEIRDLPLLLSFLRRSIVDCPFDDDLPYITRDPEGVLEKLEEALGVLGHPAYGTILGASQHSSLAQWKEQGHLLLPGPPSAGEEGMASSVEAEAGAGTGAGTVKHAERLGGAVPAATAIVGSGGAGGGGGRWAGVMGPRPHPSGSPQRSGLVAQLPLSTEAPASMPSSPAAACKTWVSQLPYQIPSPTQSPVQAHAPASNFGLPKALTSAPHRGHLQPFLSLTMRFTTDAELPSAWRVLRERLVAHCLRPGSMALEDTVDQTAETNPAHGSVGGAVRPGGIGIHLPCGAVRGSGSARPLSKKLAKLKRGLGL